jgi:hypothetical protein
VCTRTPEVQESSGSLKKMEGVASSLGPAEGVSPVGAEGRESVGDMGGGEREREREK